LSWAELGNVLTIIQDLKLGVKNRSKTVKKKQKIRGKRTTEKNEKFSV
jgi:uncharacterized Zn ribbon protein